MINLAEAFIRNKNKTDSTTGLDEQDNFFQGVVASATHLMFILQYNMNLSILSKTNVSIIAWLEDLSIVYSVTNLIM